MREYLYGDCELVVDEQNQKVTVWFNVGGKCACFIDLTGDIFEQCGTEISQMLKDIREKEAGSHLQSKAADLYDDGHRI